MQLRAGYCGTDNFYVITITLFVDVWNKTGRLKTGVEVMNTLALEDIVGFVMYVNN